MSTGYFERQPYNKDDVRSIYHVRESSIRQLSLLPPQLHPQTSIFLSHDWPVDITSYASPESLATLLRKKPHFRQDIQQGALGSPPLTGLLRVLKPRWWFSAHMHVGWEVGIWWAEGEPTEQQGEVKNPDEIVIDDDDESTPATANPVNPDEILLDDLDDVAPPPPAPPPAPPTRRQAGRREEGSFTQWIALDKCLPKRKFLEVGGFAF